MVPEVWIELQNEKFVICTVHQYWSVRTLGEPMKCTIFVCG